MRALDVSIGFGATWEAAELQEPVNPSAWQQWQTEVSFPEAGFCEVWAAWSSTT